MAPRAVHRQMTPDVTPFTGVLSLRACMGWHLAFPTISWQSSYGYRPRARS
jgi:hypothetical protein